MTTLRCKESGKTCITGGIHFGDVLVINLILLHAAKCLSFNQLRVIKHSSLVAQQAYSNWLDLNLAVRQHVQLR